MDIEKGRPVSPRPAPSPHISFADRNIARRRRIRLWASREFDALCGLDFGRGDEPYASYENGMTLGIVERAALARRSPLLCRHGEPVGDCYACGADEYAPNLSPPGRPIAGSQLKADR